MNAPGEPVAQSTKDCAAVLASLQELYRTGRLTSLVPVLPFLLRLRGKPFHLNNHFPMEPLYNLNMPKKCIVKSGRQVSKSTGFAAQSCLLSGLIPYFSSLHIAPRFDQIRRFSNNYVRPFLKESPLGQLLLKGAGEPSVTQRSLNNESVMHFSFAFLDAERNRGLASDRLLLDEIQDIDATFLPVLYETLSASEYGFISYAGTPKTFDNTIQGLWEESSQAEWVTPCHACHYWNVATVEYDLLKMIAPAGVSCAKCGKLIEPADGHWEHRFSERRSNFPGYHVPQPIMPMHYRPDAATGQRIKWAELLDAMAKYNKAKFYNEKLGESCDMRVGLVTRRDLLAASTLPWQNNLKEALKRIYSYPFRAMGIDWGGGGEAGVSYTTIAILGFTPEGKIDALYTERLTSANTPQQEAGIVLKYYRAFACNILAHDFGGAGSIRETLLIQAGFPPEQLFPASYRATTASAIVTYKPPTALTVRSYYSVDKARSLMLLCQLIKAGYYRFPAYLSWEDLASDFLSLIEEKRETPYGSDIFIIGKKSGRTDDIVHSINLASLAYWHVHQRYPSLAASLLPQFTDQQEHELTDGEPAGADDSEPA